MKAAQAEGSRRAGQSLDGDGEAAGQAGCFAFRRLCGGLSPRLTCLTKCRGDHVPLIVPQCHSGPTSLTPLPASGCTLRTALARGWRGVWGHGPRRSLARGKERTSGTPRRSALFNTSAWNKSCHCTWGHSLWGPAFSLPTTHGGPCLWGAWPVWLWSGAFLRPSLGEPVVLMHTSSLRAVVLRPYSTSCLHLCPLFVCGWSTAVPISFALRAGNLGQPSTSHRWEKR